MDEDTSLRVVTWWDKSLRLWSSVFHDPEGNQVGLAGYGTSKSASLFDLTTQELPQERKG